MRQRLRAFWLASIRRQVILAFVVVSMSLMAVFGFAMLERQRAFLQHESVMHARGLAHTAAVSSASWVMANDVVGLQEVVDSIGRSRSIKYVLVLSPDGRVLASSRSEEVGLYVNDALSQRLIRSQALTARVLMDSAKLVDVAEPVMAGANMVGWVRIGLGRDEIAENLHQIELAAMSMMLVALVATLLVATLLSGGLARRLRHLVAITERIHAGERGVRAEVVGSDEVAMLSESFNRMLDELHRSEREMSRLNEVLHESEERWRYALEGAGDGVWDWEVQSGRIMFSRRWKEMLGYREDEFGDSFAALEAGLHPDDRTRVLEAVQDYFDERHAEYRVEFRMHCKDDGWKWILARGIVVSRDDQGRPLRMIGTHTDISERKRAEEALKQREAYNKLLFADSRVAMVVIDAANGKYIDCNQAAVEIYGLHDRAEVIGLTPLDVSAETQYDGSPSAEAAQARVGKALACGAELFEWRHRRPDGQVWDAKVHLMRLQQGEATYLLFTLEDITERKRVRDELAIKTEALQRSNADLERFAYSVSHDMRQPLRAVSGHLQLLARSLKEKLDEEERENLKFALEGAKRMDSMILSLLEYSRVGRKTGTRTRMPSRESLDEALEFLEPMRQQSDGRIEVRGTWPEVTASRDELTRLFQNLIGNGLHYHEAGVAPQVEVESEVADGQWRVRVKDHGIGIAPAQIDRLFQFFSRLQARTKFDGTGMGLALCRRIVEHHGGRIWAESEGEGRGSAFCFAMPLAEEEGRA